MAQFNEMIVSRLVSSEALINHCTHCLHMYVCFVHVGQIFPSSL